MNSHDSSVHRDYLAPLTDEELHFLGPPPLAMHQFGGFVPRERGVYRRNLNRANDTMRMEMHAYDQHNSLCAREREQVLNAELAKLGRMIPLREEYLQNPYMFEDDDESDDDDWIDEWNRGMREIEQELDGGAFELKQNTREPPARHAASSFRREVPISERVRTMSSITDRSTRPSRASRKPTFFMHETSSTSSSISVKTGKPKKKPGRPRKAISKNMPARLSSRSLIAESSAFRKANPRECVLRNMELRKGSR